MIECAWSSKAIAWNPVLFVVVSMSIGFSTFCFIELSYNSLRVVALFFLLLNIYFLSFIFSVGGHSSAFFSFFKRKRIIFFSFTLSFNVSLQNAADFGFASVQHVNYCLFCFQYIHTSHDWLPREQENTLPCTYCELFKQKKWELISILIDFYPWLYLFFRCFVFTDFHKSCVLFRNYCNFIEHLQILRFIVRYLIFWTIIIVLNLDDHLKSV